MKKRAILLCIFLILSICIILNLSASKQDSLGELKALNAKTNKIQLQVLSELEKQDKIRVIVKLKDNSKEIENIDKNKINHRFLSSNSFSAGLNKDDLIKLAGDSNIEKVYYDIPVRAFLQNSTKIINATLIWPLQINNLNFTGLGQGVCILDTGINYSHQDLGGCSLKNLSLNGNNISYILQTAHNYNNNNNTIWKINYTGFSNIAVHFINISTEAHFDYVRVYNGNMTEIAVYQGLQRDIWTPYVEGDTIYVRLTTDTSVTDYGFYIDQIINGTTNTTYNWNNCSKTLFGWDFYNSDPDPYDDNGHGTHVAGIVAANGSLTGVAPNSNLVIAKVLNSSGSGVGSDIDYAIDWCVNNSEKYNISVIVMSLGSDTLYSNYCDSESNAAGYITVSVINSAIAKNISVVIATGNAGNSASISWPACIQNATPIGSATKADVVSDFSNRNSLVNLLAPGGTSSGSTSCSSGNMPINYICSADDNGDYIGYSGTSMAAPHVAGAIAIIKQVLALMGKSKTPKQIEAVLNNTGKRITDIATGINYSRIDLYSAILSLDELSPNTTLTSPQNNSQLTSTTQTFLCNITDDLQLKNTTLFIWNLTSIYYQNYSDLTGNSAQTNFSITNMPFSSYTWNYYSCDIKSNCSFSSSNFSLTILGVVSTLSYPQNNAYSRINATNFSCNSSSINSLSNITFYIWNSSDSILYNQSINISGILNSTMFNYTFLNEGNYKWNCLSVDNQSNSSFSSENFTTTYDITIPNLTLITDSESYTSNSKLVYFYFNITDNSPTNCSLIVNNAISKTENISALNNQTQNISQTFTPRTYTWSINCSDYAGNLQNSSQKTLTITAESVTTSSGGGGGGGITAQTYSPTESQLSSGVSYGCGGGDKIKFSLLNSGESSLTPGETISAQPQKAEHTLTLNRVSQNYANITIQSNPINLIIYLNQELKLNLSSPDYYDLYIKLNSILNNKANITIRSINELIIKTPVNQESINKSEKQVHIFTESKSYLIRKILIISLSIIVIIIIIYVITLVNKLPSGKVQNETNKKA